MVDWVKFEFEKWIGGVRRLSNAERGVYIDMLAAIYENGGPVEYEPDRMWKAFGCPNVRNFKRSVEGLIHAKKLELKDGKLKNGKASEVLELMFQTRSVKQQNAFSGWKKRKQKQQPDDATALQARSTRASRENIDSNKGEGLSKGPSPLLENECDSKAGVKTYFVKVDSNGYQAWVQWAAETGQKLPPTIHSSNKGRGMYVPAPKPPKIERAK